MIIQGLLSPVGNHLCSLFPLWFMLPAFLAFLYSIELREEEEIQRVKQLFCMFLKKMIEDISEESNKRSIF